jgi:hypothetical protein
MINVLRIWGSTAFDVNLTNARRMAKVVLTTIGPIEELAAAAASQPCWRKSYVSESEPSSRGNFLMKLTIQDDDDGDHDTILMEYRQARYFILFIWIDICTVSVVER